MDELPLLRANQRRRDIDHLQLVSIFHFVAVGLSVVGIAMLFGHYAMISKMMSNPQLWQKSGAPPPPVEFFAPLKWMYAVFGLWFAGTGALNLLSALFMRARKHRLFSLVVACLDCLYMPLGTVLGVFTIVVLVRESVRDLYRTKSAPLRD